MRAHYDFRGNTSGVCPECGTPIGDKQKKKLQGLVVKEDFAPPIDSTPE